MSPGYDDNRKITLTGPGWEELPDGTWQLLVNCATLLDYTQLPSDLRFGDKEVHKMGWNSDKKLAMYRTYWTDIAEAMRQLL
jgi:hypothetical protein